MLLESSDTEARDVVAEVEVKVFGALRFELSIVRSWRSVRDVFGCIGDIVGG